MMKIRVEADDLLFMTKAMTRGMKNMSIKDLAEKTKEKAYNYYNETPSKGYSHHSAMHFKIWYQMYANGTFSLFADARSEKGFNYAQVLEHGRGPISGRLMTFRGLSKPWVSTTRVGRVYARLFMSRTFQWLQRSFGRYWDMRVQELINSHGTRDGWGLAYSLQ